MRVEVKCGIVSVSAEGEGISPANYKIVIYDLMKMATEQLKDIANDAINEEQEQDMPGQGRSN